jgi:cobalamin biosynthesis protein CobT
MHLPSHKLQLHPKLANVLHHSTSTSTPNAPEAPKPAKTHSSLNIKDKRNFKIGIAALQAVSKWTDKAALTLEKLEGQGTSKHSQERQARVVAGSDNNVYEKEVQDTGVWRETVIHPVPSQASASRGIEAREEPKVTEAPTPSNKQESQITAKVVEILLAEPHHVRDLSSVVEHCNESSDDEDDAKVSPDHDTDVDADTDDDSSDVSSDEEKEDDSDGEKKTNKDSDDDSDSEEEESSDDAEDSEEDEELEVKHPVTTKAKEG